MTSFLNKKHNILLPQSTSTLQTFDDVQAVENVELLQYPQYRCSQIDFIFPCDIMQHILSFDGLYHCKRVNKQWKELCDKNETIYMKQIYKSIENRKANNNTYIIHPQRSKLNKLETQFGYKLIRNNITSIMHVVESGDRILIHNGKYKASMTWRRYLGKDIEFIGVEDNVIIEGTFQIGVSGPTQHIECNAYFENISFIPGPTIFNHGGRVREDPEIIRVSYDSHLYLKKCRLQFRKRGIMVEPTGYLDVDNCEFVGGSVAIQTSFVAAEINVIDTIFTNCGNVCSFDKYSGEYGCILVNDGWILRRDDLDLVQIKCISNIFEDNLCYPVCERHPYDFITQNIKKEIVDIDRYYFKDNILRGYNGTEITKIVQIEDANQIYYNDEPLKTPIFRY